MEHPVNFEVIKKEYESEDKLIKRFLKKTSKNQILKQFLEKQYFVSKSEKNRRKRRRKQFLSKIKKEGN